MPPKTIKVKPKIKCIKFGEILIDENKKIMLLCVNCNVDFINYTEFCNHLKTKCATVKHIFNSIGSNMKLDCGAGNLLSNVTQANRELLVYDINSNANIDSDCVLNIEQEILNPRWYTDVPKSSPIRKKDCRTYNNLIEEVTPFVQFKENLRTSTPKRLKVTQNNKPATNTIQVKQQTSPGPKVIEIKEINTCQLQKEETQQKFLTNKSVKAAQSTPIQTTTNLSLKRKIKENPSCQKVTLQTQQIESSPAIKRQCTQQLINSKLQSAANIKQNPPKMIINLTTSPNKNNITAQIQQLKQQVPQIISIGSTSQGDPPPRRPRIVNPIDPTSLQQQQQAPQKTCQQTLINAQRAPIAAQQLSNTKSNIKLNNNNHLQQKASTPKFMTKSLSTTSSSVRTPVSAPVTAVAPILSTQKTQKDKTTVDILNKLQTLGLKVQRTNPTPTILPRNNEKNNAAMEIIKKLQSKGMEVKRVPKQCITKETISTMTVPLITTGQQVIRHQTPIVLSSTKPSSQHNIFIQKIT